MNEKEMLPNLYFYRTTAQALNWYDNYRTKALLTSYDDTQKGIDH